MRHLDVKICYSMQIHARVKETVLPAAGAEGLHGVFGAEDDEDFAGVEDAVEAQGMPITSLSWLGTGRSCIGLRTRQ